MSWKMENQKLNIETFSYFYENFGWLILFLLKLFKIDWLTDQLIDWNVCTILHFCGNIIVLKSINDFIQKFSEVVLNFKFFVLLYYDWQQKVFKIFKNTQNSF